MPWLQKRGMYWWIGWRLNGDEFRQSTKETDKSKAQKKLQELELLESARAHNALTEEYFNAVTGRKVEKPSAAKFFSNWLTESASVTTPSTMNKYRQVVREFSEFAELDSKALMLPDITIDHVSGFLADKRKHLAHGTVKGYRRILGSIFLLAQNSGLITANPVALSKSRGRTSNESIEKRAFTLVELNTLYTKASPFWKFMVLASYFTGGSLGDLISLKAGNVDLMQNQITMIRRKTGKQVIVPITPKLREAFVAVWPKDGGYFWPKEAERYLSGKSGANASPFSQEFYDLLADCGLVKARDDKQSKGKGRDAKRKLSGLGFHNIRHTFVTHLKISGAPDSVAKALAGHGSDAVSKVYTHLPIESLSKGVNQLEDFTTVEVPE